MHKALLTTARTFRAHVFANLTDPIILHVPLSAAAPPRRMSSSDAVKIDAPPTTGQLVEHEGKVYTTVREGKAYILVPPNARTSVNPQAKSQPDDGTQVQNVFYNPIQQFNRDLSVLAIKAFGEDVCRRKTLKHGLQKRHRQEKKQKNGHASSERNGLASGQKRKRDDAEGTAEQSRLGVRQEEHDEIAAQEVNMLGDGVNGVSGKVGGSEATLEEKQNSGHGASEEILDEQAPGMETTESSQPQWRPRFRILDALSATGLRALRYASEIPSATQVVANDRDGNAVQSINVNVEHNKLTSAIETITGDAIAHMYQIAFPSQCSHGPHHHSKKYDVIDLDPYGTAAPFIDSALQALEDGGLLCVTCTDSGVWASCGYCEKTYALYGGMPVKGLHSHEAGLRLILNSVATAAAKQSLAIEPLLSLSIDFYARVFIRVRKSPIEVKFLAGKTMLVYGCDAGCGAWKTQFIGRHQLHKNSNTNYKYSMAQGPTADRLCEHCGSKTHIAGPMWGGPLHNPAFIEKILRDLEDVDEEVYCTKRRIEGMLDTALDELYVNRELLSTDNRPEVSDETSEIIPKLPMQFIDQNPFYFVPSSLCKVIKAQAPRDDQLKGALRHAGYNVARTHCKAGAIKTDAPWAVIWEIMREWVRQKSPIKDGVLKEGQPGYKIIQAMRTTEAEEKELLDAAAEIDHDNESPRIVTEGEKVVVRERPSDPREMKVVFDQSLGKDNKPGKRLVRYQQNPRENWGPMTKAKGSG